MHKTTRLTLQAVYDLNTPSVRDIADEIEKSHTTAENHLEKLEGKGFIRVQETDHTNIRTVTDEGEDEMLKNPLDLEGVDSSESEVDPFFVHFFAINCNFNDKNFLPEDWRERFKEFESMKVEEHPEFDRIQVKTAKWVYRLTGRSLEVRLSHEVSGSDVRQLKDRAWDKAIEGLEEFEKAMQKELGRPDFEFPKDRMTIRIQSQHIGARRKDITKAFIDHIDQNTIWDPRKFRVEGEDEEIRIYCDASGPGGMLESESGNGGQVNGRLDTAEDDRALLQDFTRDLIENPSSAHRIVDTPKRLDRVEQTIHEDMESVSEVKGQVQRVEQEVRSLEKGIGQQLQEVVSVVQQDSLSSSRVIEVLEEMSSSQKSLEEKLINVEERNNAALTAVVQELQEIKQQGVEEDSSDLVEETVEDLLEDSRFSSPGLQYGHLMAWDTRKQECRKILDKTVVEKSDSKMLELIDVWKK